MHPRELSIKDFIYDLPAAQIAFHPLEQRDASRLLIFREGAISTDIYRNIADQFTPGTFLIFNNTKVVEARLLFQKTTGGIIEIFCLEPAEDYADITTAMNQIGKVRWLCMVGGAAKWKKGTTLQLPFITDGKNHLLEARLIEKRSDSFLIELEWEAALSFAEVLHHAGHVPLPPYIKRVDEAADKTRYQTIFAEQDGSVAAPTAGLHFTPEVLSSLASKQITTRFVTLHVGAGTFKPVKADSMQEHEMHSEYIETDKALIEELAAHKGGPVVAVGTTSMRTLESLYWLGVQILNGKERSHDGMLQITQWEAYEQSDDRKPTAGEALAAVLEYMQKRNTDKLIARTQIIIAPGYRFRLVNGLVTNFHQPASTLLLLVAAFIGPRWRELYAYALQNDFRFLSYGDGCLLWRQADES